MPLFKKDVAVKYILDHKDACLYFMQELARTSIKEDCLSVNILLQNDCSVSHFPLLQANKSHGIGYMWQPSGKLF